MTEKEINELVRLIKYKHNDKKMFVVNDKKILINNIETFLVFNEDYSLKNGTYYIENRKVKKYDANISYKIPEFKNTVLEFKTLNDTFHYTVKLGVYINFVEFLKYIKFIKAARRVYFTMNNEYYKISLNELDVIGKILR